jgi:hypothetical protein
VEECTWEVDASAVYARNNNNNRKSKGHISGALFARGTWLRDVLADFVGSRVVHLTVRTYTGTIRCYFRPEL